MAWRELHQSQSRVLQLNHLSIKMKEYWQEGNVAALRKSLQSLLVLWDTLKGIPLCLSDVVLYMTTFCTIVQIQLLMCSKYLLSTTPTAHAAYDDLLSRLSKIVMCSKTQLLERLHNILAVLKESQKGLLLQLLMKITLIVVLLESLCDIDFDGKNILKTIYIFLPYASLNVDDLWMMVTEIKNYIAPELVNWEQIYYNAWKDFDRGDRVNALTTLSQLKMSPTQHTQDLVNILKGNLYFHEDKPNWALISYSNSAASSSVEIVKLSLWNTSYLFQKSKNDGELDIRSILIKLCRKIPSTLSVIIYSEGRVSHFSQHSKIWRQFLLFSGLRAIELKRYEDSVSFLTKVIEDIGEPLKDYSICYLLVMKSLLLNHDYNRCWTMLWEILKYFSIGDMNESFLKVKLQVCYLGCYLSICQHKFHLAEVLGYWCLQLGNSISTQNLELKSWIGSVQKCCLTLICVMYVGKTDLSRAFSWLMDASSVYDMQSSLLTAYTYTLVMLKRRSNRYNHLRNVLLPLLENYKTEKYPSSTLMKEAETLAYVLIN